MYGELHNSTYTAPMFVVIPWKKILLGVILYAITIVTILGNVIVLFSVKINKKLQTIFNYYIVNLAITDVAVALTAMSFKATHIVLGYWPFGEGLCALWIFFDYGMTFVSVFTLNMISLDRFWCVKWSVHYRQHHTKRRCIISIVFVWVFMLILWIPPWLMDRLRNSKPGECFWDPSLNKEFVFIVAILGHHAPFCIMIFSYTYVFLFMRKRTKFTDVILSHTRSAAVNATVANNRGSTEDSSSVLQINGSNVLEKKYSTVPQVCLQPKEGTNIHSSHSFIYIQNTGNIGNEVQTMRISRFTRERQVFRTLTYIIIGYGILWLPFHIVFDLGIAYPGLVCEDVLNIFFWMTYLNSTINPILYNSSNSEFRITLRNIFIKFKCV